MAVYNAKKLTVVKGDDTYIIDPLQGNESVYNDIPVTIQKTDWSGTAPYTYVHSDSHITANAAIAVYFKDGVRDGLVGDLKFTKATGSVTFVTDEPPVGDIPIVIRVIDSTTNGVYPIDAEMIETDAVIGETTVQGALEDLDGRTQPATTSAAGIVQLSNTVGNDSTTKPATAYVTNVAYRRASNAITDLAATYSNSKTYSKGDYCTAYEKLYRANTNISTAEEWNSAHWDEVALADEVNLDNAVQSANIANLKSDIGIVEDTNSATHAISKDQYVIWKGSLYKASTNISIGTTLSTSTNLTAISNGITNEMKSKVDALNSNITNLLTVEEVDVDGTSAAAGAFEAIKSCAKTGYTPIAIAGFNFTRVADINYTGVILMGTSTNIYILGYNSGSARTFNGKVNVLYKKDL